jgi:hypothetical protein
VLDYFSRHKITWHQHRNHALSSQVCCLNFLAPLAEDRELLSQVIGGALGIDEPEMLEVEEGASGRPWFVGFEWIGRGNHLNEWPKRGAPTRGANVTSADAVVRFRARGRVETILIEWKYTESYGPPIPAKGNDTRTRRYESLAFSSDQRDEVGPIRRDAGVALADFYFEPFYQLLRQQMLANEMERSREDGADVVRVLHLSPAGNIALHKVTSPAFQRFGDDAFAAFGATLARPDRFIGRTTEEVFGPLLRGAAAGSEWANYLLARYRFLDSAKPAHAA